MAGPWRSAHPAACATLRSADAPMSVRRPSPTSQGGFDAAGLLGVPGENPAGDGAALGSGHRIGGLFTRVSVDEGVQLTAAQIRLIQQGGTGQRIQHGPGLPAADPQDGGGQPGADLRPGAQGQQPQRVRRFRPQLSRSRPRSRRGPAPRPAVCREQSAGPARRPAARPAGRRAGQAGWSAGPRSAAPGAGRRMPGPVHRRTLQPSPVGRPAHRPAARQRAATSAGTAVPGRYRRGGRPGRGGWSPRPGRCWAAAPRSPWPTVCHRSARRAAGRPTPPATAGIRSRYAGRDPGGRHAEGPQPAAQNLVRRLGQPPHGPPSRAYR